MDGWIRQDIIYNKNDAVIYDVSGGYVMKVIQDPKSFEMVVVRRVREARPRSCVALPEEENGVGPNWYIMRHYDGTIDVDPFCQSQWRNIGIQVLQFLQDFHHRVGMAHMDIKRGNILVDRSAGTFHVCDFGNASAPSADKRVLGGFCDNSKWYYLAMGGELDQPMVSWRMDLVALGYVLATLQPSWSWRFENECWEKRAGRGILSIESVLEVRRVSIMLCTELRPYFTRLTLLPWTSVEPPAPEFYEELAALFRIYSNCDPQV